MDNLTETVGGSMNREPAHRYEVAPLRQVEVPHPGLTANFQEAAIVKAHTLAANILDKVLKAKIRPGFVVGNVSEGEHPLWMGFRDSTSPVVGYRALVLMAVPATAVKRLLFTGIDIEPVPGDILTFVGR